MGNGGVFIKWLGILEGVLLCCEIMWFWEKEAMGPIPVSPSTLKSNLILALS